MRSYPEVIEHDPRAQDVPVQGDQVRLEGSDEETGLVSVDVQTVALQQLLLVPPAFRPVLRQLLYLRRGRECVGYFSCRRNDVLERLSAATLSSFCSTMSDRFPSLSSLSDGLRSRCCWSRGEGEKGRWGGVISQKSTERQGNVIFRPHLSPLTELKASSREALNYDSATQKSYIFKGEQQQQIRYSVFLRELMTSPNE